MQRSQKIVTVDARLCRGTKLWLIGLILTLITMPLSATHGTFRFGSQKSAIKLVDGATFDLINSFTNLHGTLKKKDISAFLGKQIYFEEGFLETGLTSIFLTGSYIADETGTDTIRLHGSEASPHLFRADAGTFLDYLEIAGDKNRVEGLPGFNNPIEFLDSSASLTIAIQSSLNQDINLNGGTLTLDDDLTLADGIRINGPGVIYLNNRRLSFGTEDLIADTPLYWIGAADLYLPGKVELSSSWTFEKNCYFNGDSTNLNLRTGSSLTIMRDSALHIKQINIKGLGGEPGEGKIYFEDDTDFPNYISGSSSSKLRIRRAALELTSTYTIHHGHVVIEFGSAHVITRDNLLYFSDDPADPKQEKLTIEGVNLFYKTRTFTDNNNIRPFAFNDVNSPITINNNGDIVHFGSFRTVQESASTYHEGKLTGNVFLGFGLANTKRIVSEQPNVDGQGWYFHFARNKTNLLRVASDVTEGTLTDIVLKDINPQHIDLEGVNSRLFFRDNVTVELGNDINFGTGSFARTWTFQGNCKFDGKGKVVTMGDGQILVQALPPSSDPSTLIIQDMIIEDLQEDSIKIDDDNSRVILKDVKFLLAEDVNFPKKGSFEIAGDVEFYSAYNNNAFKLIYDSTASQASKIQSCSMLHFDRDVTFHYDSSINNQKLEMANRTSVLSFNGSTLSAADVGLELTKGTLLFDHKCFISGGINPISLGDGIDSANDLNVEFMPGGNIDITAGILNYNNVNG